MNESGSELLTAFVAGDAEAFDAFYDRYHRLVLSTVRQCVPRHLKTEVNDICQQFWVNLIRWSNSYDPNRSIKTWMISVIRSATRSYARKQSPDTEKVVSDPDLDTICTREKSPESKMILREEFEIVMDALEQIPQELQEIVRAVYIDGQTPADYARANGMTQDKASGRLQRGLRKLRESRTVKQLRPVGV